MAPELLTNKQNSIGSHVDIWAIGVILYGMVIGKLPFAGNNPRKLMEEILEGVDFPNNIINKLSIEYIDLIEKIFCVDYKKRINLNDIMEHPWILETKIQR